MANKGITIRLACNIMVISETCYRHEARLNSENAEIADWLIQLTDNHRNWGFGLCFLWLRNVKGFGWNGNPPCKKLGLEVEFSRYEGVLHEAVEIYG